MGLSVVQPSARKEYHDTSEEGTLLTRIPSGYVQEPKTGKYRWVVSVDATSLYPSIIMQHNLSPEMLAENHKPIDCTVESILERKHKPKLKDANLSMNAMNGYLFRKDRQGFMAEITQKFFDDRQRYKKLMKHRTGV